MKILVTYFSQTGNTEKIAKAISEAVAPGNEVELKKMEVINADDTAGYDFVFVGSPLHASNLAAPVKEFLSAMSAGPGRKMAGFITHSAPAYPDQAMDGFTEPMTTACSEKGIEYKGCFDCQGFLTEALHEMIKKGQNATDEEWTETVKQMTGHPDDEDLARAKEFAKEALA
jgi:flavodoxin